MLYTATPTVITFDVFGNAMDNASAPTRFLAGRSIAATGWVLDIDGQTGSFLLDVDKIDDIEFLIAYKHSNRIAP